MDNYNDATLLQQSFFNIMSAKQYSFQQGVDAKLKAIAESLGVKFKKKK